MSTNHNEEMSIGGDQQQQQQIDGFSNLWLNGADEETAALDQYESEMDRTINDNLLNEKEQSNQKLFQSFQTSACAVAQMFKDSTTNNTSSTPQVSSWQSFQNAAGAITVLYKGNNHKTHMFYLFKFNY